MTFLVAGVVAGVWLLVFDMVLMEPVLGSFLANIPGMNATPPMMWVIVGDVVAGLVLALVYNRVKSVFGTGLANGARYGFFAGLLVSFPLWLQMSVYVSWPYAAAWAMTIAGVVIYTVAGALVGLVFEKMAGAPSA